MRLVPVRDADDVLVAKVNPATHQLHHPISGRLLKAGTLRHRYALEALHDYVQAAPPRARKRAEKAARKAVHG